MLLKAFVRMQRMSSKAMLGVVMAGGASRRMGFDKRNFEFSGRSLVERSAQVLRPVCEEVVISMQPGEVWESPSLRTIHDRRARSGPLAGLESALEEAQTAAATVFLLACDLPHVGTSVVRHVLDCAHESKEYAAAVPTIEGRTQPLCALYRGTAMNAVRCLLEEGKRAMHDLLDSLPVLEVPLGPSLPFYRPDLFHNLNEPDDLAAFRSIAVPSSK